MFPSMQPHRPQVSLIKLLNQFHQSLPTCTDSRANVKDTPAESPPPREPPTTDTTRLR